jgi:hypothetical protein
LDTYKLKLENKRIKTIPTTMKKDTAQMIYLTSSLFNSIEDFFADVPSLLPLSLSPRDSGLWVSSPPLRHRLARG